MHTSDALERGESAIRISMVGVWREARHLFSPAELAALELAEQLTHMDDEAVSDSVYARALGEFGEEGLGHLIAQILTINTWNRIARATGKVAGTDERRK
jgi:alkylhydroperoxidase family enzyme